MRKLTREIVEAWARGDRLSSGNTSTDGLAIWLHENTIAWKTADADVIALTLAGYPTVTTRERLNGVLNFYGIGYRFAQRNFEPVLIIGRDVVEIGEHEHVYFNIATKRVTDWEPVARLDDYIPLCH
tara:strand:+ start:182 stop:562 length:381 start_codon:yes stop_codon:yes gene_type:complete